MILARLTSGQVIAAALLGAVLSSCILTQGRKAGNDSPQPPASVVPQAVASQLTSTSVVAYAQACKAALGLPEATIPAWNCLTGLEIPTTVAGQALNATNYPQLISHAVGCDNPSWLGAEPCANYAFVTHRTLAPGVEAYLICRDQTFTTYKSRAQRLADLQTTPSPDSFDAYFSFGSLGMIWTNTATGTTCFFDQVTTTPTQKIYGGYIPSPDDATIPTFDQLPDPKPPTEYTTGANAVQVWQKNAEPTWRKPLVVATQDNCVVCHDTGPLKGSAWMQQVLTIPANPQTVPLLVYGDVFNSWKEQFPLQSISTTPVTVNGKSEPQVCTTCHRIGSQSTCGGVPTFTGSTLSYAVGLTSPQVTGFLGLDFAHRTWMPPQPSSWTGQSDAQLTALWNAAYAPHVSRLQCCCKNPTAINCTAQDMTVSPLGAPVAGTGPAVCN